ncbi:MAG: M20/M25/M40 family metallo-hydrolase [Clostridia bacterium]|nr:M20/M25/M40 family metallo-hydrolase [Clostridia bacterium]
MYSLIKQIVCCPGTSGSEGATAELLSDIMKDRSDEIYRDRLGNLICRKKGRSENARRVLLCAHMDEIGFIATYIENSGLIRIAPIGGINFTASSYSEVIFENGVAGVLVPDSGVAAGSFAADVFGVDIGASSAAEASRRVKIGDRCAMRQTVRRLGGGRICGRPLDDRVGCAILAEIAEKLAGTETEDDIYYVFSVQEEVGLRGAGPAAFGIRPDVALVYDVTGTGDTAGAKPMEVKLGGGAAIKLRDSSVICNPGLADELAKIGKEKGIKTQFEILRAGGTDTAAIQASASGCIAGAISIPCRFIHSGVETVDLADVKACVDLTVAYLTK